MEVNDIQTKADEKQDKPFAKKFRVRVKFDYYYIDKSWYKVQYAHYRLIPNWKSIYSFDSFGDEGYHSDRMFPIYDSAVSFANKIKSIDDVNRLHQIEHDRYRKWKSWQNEIWNRNKPKRRITNVL